MYVRKNGQVTMSGNAQISNNTATEDVYKRQIVYCVTSALGFAAIENVLYCLGGDFGTAVTRDLLSVPSHAIDGVIMGYFCGVAKEAELAGDKKRRKRYLKLSVFMPMIEHGIYDSALSLDADLSLIHISAAPARIWK